MHSEHGKWDPLIWILTPNYIFPDSDRKPLVGQLSVDATFPDPELVHGADALLIAPLGNAKQLRSTEQSILCTASVDTQPDRPCEEAQEDPVVIADIVSTDISEFF
jgi:hypothetical protein